MEDVERRVAEALVGIFGERLELLAVHGSEVAGDAFPGFSDLDLVAMLGGGGLGLEAALTCAERLAVDLGSTPYMQVDWIDADAPRPSLVPSSFRVLLGDGPPTELLHTAFTLRMSGAAWLEQLPDLIQRDTEDWAISVGRRPRQLRLLVTRVKPTVRAWLTTLGEDPLATYSAPWGRLANAVRRHDPGIAGLILELVDGLRADPRDELALGSTTLHVLSRIAAHV
jgi:hypothetical protein